MMDKTPRTRPNEKHLLPLRVEETFFPHVLRGRHDLDNYDFGNKIIFGCNNNHFLSRRSHAVYRVYRLSRLSYHHGRR